MRPVTVAVRTFVPAVARVLAAVLLVVSVAPLVHLDDLDCDPIIAAHDSTAPVLAGSGSSGYPDVHCAACHFVRIVREPVDSQTPASVRLSATGLVLAPLASVPVARPELPLPARAPPVHA